MSQMSQTDSVRIDKELLDKVRVLAKAKGQTLSGYINVNLSKTVNRDWLKTNNAEKNKV